MSRHVHYSELFFFFTGHHGNVVSAFVPKFVLYGALWSKGTYHVTVTSWVQIWPVFHFVLLKFSQPLQSQYLKVTANKQTCYMKK